jgi:hypothetical protein
MKVVRSSPLRTGRLYPHEFSWYSFLETESTPGHMVPLVASEKNPQRHDWGSSPRTSDWQSSALTTTLPQAPCRLKHPFKTQDSTVGMTTRYGLDDSGMESRWERDFPHPFRTTLGPIQPPIKWIPGPFPGVKRQGGGVNHPPHLAPRLKKE